MHYSSLQLCNQSLYLRSTNMHTECYWLVLCVGKRVCILWQYQTYTYNEHKVRFHYIKKLNIALILQITNQCCFQVLHGKLQVTIFKSLCQIVSLLSLVSNLSPIFKETHLSWLTQPITLLQLLKTSCYKLMIKQAHFKKTKSCISNLHQIHSVISWMVAWYIFSHTS